MQYSLLLVSYVKACRFENVHAVGGESPGPGPGLPGTRWCSGLSTSALNCLLRCLLLARAPQSESYELSLVTNQLRPATTTSHPPPSRHCTDPIIATFKPLL
ncbi:hypothetical protein MN608_01171 [Microdochium nivale]|nr:hypothetical protein MN608_01171 [Microdochium nivale]